MDSDSKSIFENLEEVTDEQLVELSLEGSEEAKAELMRRHYRKVYNISFKFTGKFSEAEDLTQEVFFKIFKQLDKFNPEGTFKFWLQRVARNHSIDHYRKTRKEKQLLLQESTDIVLKDEFMVDQHELIERKENIKNIFTEINKLPPSLRDCLIMRDVQGYSYQEIASVLRLPVGTVKSRINRSRKELIKRLKIIKR